MERLIKLTKEALLKKYEVYKDSEHLGINLYIHMPDDSIEIIYNSMGHNKIEYIKSAYDENLVHHNSKDIYIIDVQFFSDKLLEFDFGSALTMMKLGKRVARKGWNGKGMFLYYVPSNNYKPSTSIAEKYCVNDDGNVPYCAYIAMKTVNGMIVPWLASQTDLLTKDWFIVDD